jgi:hypothetical protein
LCSRVNTTVLSDTLVTRSHRMCYLKDKGLVGKKPMDLCARESEEYTNGVGAGVNTTLVSDTLSKRSRRMC